MEDNLGCFFIHLDALFVRGIIKVIISIKRALSNEGTARK